LRNITILLLLLLSSLLYSGTLKEAFDLAEAGSVNGITYNKVVELQTGEIYTGGLLIGKSLINIDFQLLGDEGIDVCIVGNGAVLDLQGEQICISYCGNRLDISDCIVINGNIRFRGIDTGDFDASPEGSVKYVTMYKPHDFGIRLQGAGEGVTLERNIVVDAINTGYDFIYSNGYATEWIPTGINYAPSVQVGAYGYPLLTYNWSFHSIDSLNTDVANHFCFL